MELNANRIADIINNLVEKTTDNIINKTWKRGIIASVAGQAASVYIEGNTTATPGVPCLGSYYPIVGDKVLVLSIGATGSNLLIMGPIYITITSSNTITSAATITPSSTSYFVTALAVNTTIASPGVALNGNKMLIRIKDNGTARTITWNAIFRGIGTGLPSTTVANKTLYIGIMYNANDTKWDVLSVSQEL